MNILINGVGNIGTTLLNILNEYNTVVDIVSKDEYISSSKNISLNILNDRKILEIANEIQEYYEEKKQKERSKEKKSRET